jgi:para-aminobenzoate synthetase
MAVSSKSPPLPRTVILDYYDSCELGEQHSGISMLKLVDTNNILTLFTKLYSDEEVLKKVVVIKHDRYTW